MLLRSFLTKIALALALALALSCLVVACDDAQQPLSARTDTRGTLPSEKEAIYDSLNAGSIKVAQALLKDDWDIGPRTPLAHLPAPLSWTEDPFDDRSWKISFYGLRPLSHLLYAYYATHDHAYRDKLVELLHSCADADSVRAPNPDTFDFGQTPAFRTMMLVNAYGKLKRSGDLEPDLAKKLEGALERSAESLLNPYNFDVDGTHAITEASALMILAENFPELPIAKMSRDVAGERLMATLTKSVDSDGVDLRGSPGHHFYVLSAVLAIHHWADRFGVALPSGFGDRVHAMLRYATHIPQPDSALPLLGATGRFDIRDLNPALYDELDNIADAPTKKNNATTTTSSLTLAADFGFSFVRSRGKTGDPPTERNVVFAESGQGVLRSSFGTAQTFLDQTYVTFTTSAKGAHNDALGITLFAGGQLLFTDSGHAEDAYFASTKAHNTIVVDDSSYEGTTSRGLIKTEGEWAYQSGKSEHAGVTHRRAVLLVKRDVLLVVDEVTADKSHAFAQTWHLAPDLTMAVSGNDVVGRSPDGIPVVRLQQLVPKQLETQKDGHVVVSKYEAERASWTAAYKATGASATYVTVVTLSKEATGHLVGPVVHLCVDRQAFDVTITNIAAQQGESALLINSGDCGE